MASTNSINTGTVRSGNMRKNTCLLGLITITAAFGFVSSPVRAQNAASVDQSSTQSTTQLGYGNSSVNANNQTGIVSQKQAPFTSGVNAATMSQNNAQGAFQAGYGNSSINANNQTGIVSQGHSYQQYFPHNGGINATGITQQSGQAVGQSGIGNSALNSSNQGTTVQQH